MLKFIIYLEIFLVNDIYVSIFLQAIVFEFDYYFYYTNFYYFFIFHFQVPCAPPKYVLFSLCLTYLCVMICSSNKMFINFVGVMSFHCLLVIPTKCCFTAKLSMYRTFKLLIYPVVRLHVSIRSIAEVV